MNSKHNVCEYLVTAFKWFLQREEKDDQGLPLIDDSYTLQGIIADYTVWYCMSVLFEYD